MVGAKVLRIFKGLFQKPLKAEVWNGSSNIFLQLKKHGDAVLFACALNVGASAPNPDTRNFSGKVSWNFKSFVKIKCCFLREILLPTFLIRKVGSLAHFSPKERCENKKRPEKGVFIIQRLRFRLLYR